MSIEWKEPTKPKARNWKQIVEELQANPGRWAYMGVMPTSGGYVYAKRFGLESRVENTKNGRADVYLRYVGEGN